MPSRIAFKRVRERETGALCGLDNKLWKQLGPSAQLESVRYMLESSVGLLTSSTLCYECKKVKRIFTSVIAMQVSRTKPPSPFFIF